MSESKETVNIYLHDSDEKKRVLSEASPREKYIILMNDTLQSENRTNMLRLKELENQIEELEGDSERLETSNNNLKGLLKNFHEMDKWRREVNELELKIIKNHKKFINHYKYRATKHLRILQTLMLLFVAVYYEYFSFTQTLPLIVMFLIIASFQESTLYHLRLPIYNVEEKQLEALQTEINRTIKAQDYIHEFLDQQ